MINYFFVIAKRSVYRGHTLVQWYMVSAFKFGNQSLQKKLVSKTIYYNISQTQQI